MRDRTASRDTDPRLWDDPPVVSSMAQTSRSVRMTTANPPAIKASYSILALTSESPKTQTHITVVDNVAGDPRGKIADEKLQRN